METGDNRDEPRGKVDALSILYIVGGIPALVGFLAILFLLARRLDIPA